MTMRNRMRRSTCALALALGALAVGGCATPGPLHFYSMANPTADAVRDTAGTAQEEIPSFLAPDEQLAGLAYDPFTDHFFLRLVPGDRIRVVDRPARAVKREFKIETRAAASGGDLAIKPRDGHVFLIHPTASAVVELSRLGKPVRTITLSDSPPPAVGIAYDSGRDALFLLLPGSPSRIASYDLGGRRLGSVTLEREIAGSLAFDAEQREFYAPLATPGAAPGTKGTGVFDEHGRWRRTLPSPAIAVDVGPRSLIRVF